jgi:hypothetical protein
LVIKAERAKTPDGSNGPGQTGKKKPDAEI